MCWLFLLLLLWLLYFVQLFIISLSRILHIRLDRNRPFPHNRLFHNHRTIQTLHSSKRWLEQFRRRKRLHILEFWWWRLVFFFVCLITDFWMVEGFVFVEFRKLWTGDSEIVGFLLEFVWNWWGVIDVLEGLRGLELFYTCLQMKGVFIFFSFFVIFLRLGTYQGYLQRSILGFSIWLDFYTFSWNV